MSKILTLIGFLYSIVAMAGTAEDSCLNIHTLAQNQLIFTYTQKDKADNPYFYAKVMMGKQIIKITSYALGQGDNLVYVPNTNPHIYQVPEKAKRLYIVKTQTKLEGFDPLSQVLPEYATEKQQSGLVSRMQRNVSNYLQPLPIETNQQAGSDAAVNICEVVF